MALTPDREISLMEGEVALPRKNGELVFEAPWEGRAFGMAVALNEQRCYDWVAFQERLAARIAADEGAGAASSYYEQWLAALEALLTEQGFLTREEVEARHGEYASGLRSDDWDQAG